MLGFAECKEIIQQKNQNGGNEQGRYGQVWLIPHASDLKTDHHNEHISGAHNVGEHSEGKDFEDVREEEMFFVLDFEY